MKPVERRRWQVSGGVTGVLAAVLLLSLAGWVDAQIVPGNAEIKAVTGRVEMLRKGQTQWATASVGAKLGEGDEVRTSAGASAELVLPDTSDIVLAENTRFAVSKIVVDRQNQNRFASFHLSVGKVQAALAQSAIRLVQARQSNFVISTPTGVAATRGTTFVAAFNPATRTTVVAVLRGQIVFADFASRTPVVVGVNSFVTQAGTARPAAAVPITNLPAPVQSQLRSTRANPSTAGQPALTAPAAPAPSTPQVAATVVVAQVKVSPAQAAAATATMVAAAPETATAVTSAAVATAPTLAGAITAAAVTAAPTQAAAIAGAVVSVVGTTPLVAAAVTAGAVAAAPAGQAAAITTAAVTAAPALAAAITSGAIGAAPAPGQAAAITSAAVAAAPTQAAAITSAAVGAAPGQATAIIQAAIAAAPTQAAAITTAAATPTPPVLVTAAVAPPPPAALVAPPLTPVPIATVAQDIATTQPVTQACASPPCP